MRQFIIGEDVLGAVAQCIGAATHQVPYGQVAALIQRLDTLPQVQVGADAKPEGSSGKGKRAGKAPSDAPAEASQAA